MAKFPGPAHAPKPFDFVGVLIASATGLALTLTTLFFFAMPVSGNLAGSRDFISYWATGRQLVLHANPYDHDAISAIEHSSGLTPQAVLIMRNPPWALPLAYPLGFLNLRLAAVLWSLLLLGSLLLSVRLLQSLYVPSSGRAQALALAFTPALICITMGQTALFVLLGVVLFLRFHRGRPYVAGASLWLCALKPHLILPFIAVLVVWIAAHRNYKILAGALSSLAAFTATAFLLAPHAWPDYFALMHSPAVSNDFIPCLANFLRNHFAPQSSWLLYLPAALASFLSVVYYWRHRSFWCWSSDACPILLLSLLAAPYSWFYDQCIAIPALLRGACLTRHRVLLAALAIAILLMDAEILFVPVASYLYLWTTPVWLVWYLIAQPQAKPPLLRN